MYLPEPGLGRFVTGTDHITAFSMVIPLHPCNGNHTYFAQILLFPVTSLEHLRIGAAAVAGATECYRDVTGTTLISLQTIPFP